MIRLLFPHRRFTEAERRLIWLEGPKPEAEKTDKPKEDTRKPESKEKTKKGPDGKPDVKDATEAAKTKAAEKLAKLQADVQKNATNFYNKVLLPQFKSGEAKMTPEQKAQYPAKFAQDIQNELNATNTNLEFTVTMAKDEKGNDYPKVEVKPRPAPGPDAANPETPKEKTGTNAEKVKQGFDESIVKMGKAKSFTEAIGHLATAVGHLAHGWELAMEGKLFKKTVEVQGKQDRRTRLLGEAKKEGDDKTPLAKKLELLKTKKEGQLKDAKAVDASYGPAVDAAAKETANAKNQLEAAKKPVPPATEADKGVVQNAEEAVKKAEQTEAEVKKFVEDTKQQVKELQEDVATLTETQEDLGKMQKEIGKIIDGFKSANPAVAERLGSFTVTPEGMLIEGPDKLPDGTVPLLVQMFPEQYKDKKAVSPADLQAAAQKGPPKKEAAPKEEPGTKPAEPGEVDPGSLPRKQLKNADGEMNYRLAINKGLDATVAKAIDALAANDAAITELKGPDQTAGLKILKDHLQNIIDKKAKNEANVPYNADTIKSAEKLKAKLEK